MSPIAPFRLSELGPADESAPESPYDRSQRLWGELVRATALLRTAVNSLDQRDGVADEAYVVALAADIVQAVHDELGRCEVALRDREAIIRAADA